MVRRFLVVPLLAPWVLVLMVSVLNPRPAVSLRLLVWRSPALPLGTWLAVVSSTGALLSLSASAMALQGRRGPSGGGWPAGPRVTAFRRDRRVVEDGEEPQGEAWQRPGPAPAAAGPVRAPGEPPPTVSVPFRVIRKGSVQAQRSTTTVPSPSAASATAEANGVSDRPSWAFGRRRSTAPPRSADSVNSSGDGWDDPDDDAW